MIVRFREGATPHERDAVVERLRRMGVEGRAEDGALRLERNPGAADAIEVASMEGVAEVTRDPAVSRTTRDALLDGVAGAAALLGALILLAAHFPARLGSPADPLRTPSALRPSWPLLAWHAAVDRTPAWLPASILPLAGAALLLAWPLLARSFARRRPGLHAALGVLALLGWAGLAALELST